VSYWDISIVLALFSRFVVLAHDRQSVSDVHHTCGESGWKSWLLIGLFLAPNLINKVAFERYFDPVILVTFFLFFERNVAARFSTGRAAVLLMLFYSLLLGGIGSLSRGRS
jgi:hypothetical protein